MQEPIDSSGELMKDKRYGTGLRERLASKTTWVCSKCGCWSETKTTRCPNTTCLNIGMVESIAVADTPSFGSADYWYAEYVREREAHMDGVQFRARIKVILSETIEDDKYYGDATSFPVVKVIRKLCDALNQTEGSDDN